MTATIYSIIPPLLVLFCVLATKRVILSISLGIVTSALLLHNFQIIDALQSIVQAVIGILYSDGEWNMGNVYLISFLFILGAITSFISASGGTEAFGEWAMKRVKSRRAAALLTFILGIVIFIDDYFNALAVGQVSKPVTDRYGISRTKLAYFIDSTSAPICVISPISSWGAYIIALLGTIFATYNVSDMSAFSGFLQLVPLNFYAVLSIIMVVAVIYFNINIGPMRKFEEIAMKQINSYNETKKTTKSGSPKDLVYPILTLVAITFGMIFFTGLQGSEGDVSIFNIIENANVNISLFVASIIAVTVSIIRYTNGGGKEVTKQAKHGIGSMFGAVLILFFAWTLTDLISQIGTGSYLSALLQAINIQPSFLPVILFVIAGIMAFSTGTSWGTFGLMIPIGAQMAMELQPDLFLPSLAAVLAGAVFGDHCSPISDTTILSSTGAECNHIDHVTTQLPYAIIVAINAAIGFLLIGFTGNAILSFGITLAIFVVILVILKLKYGATEEEMKMAS